MRHINLLIFLMFITVLAAGCQAASKKAPVVEAPVVEVIKPELVVEGPKNRISLYWENTTEPHPERKPWSDHLTKIVGLDLLDTYDKAKDITGICPKYHSLNADQKTKAVSEFWVATIYYESGFNPKQYSVDVGNKNNKETWSVGLLQMSGTDSAAKKYNADFYKLQDPYVNMDVGLEQMRRQVKRCGELILPNHSPCRYWAILLKNNKYNQIEKVKSRVLKQAPFCK